MAILDNIKSAFTRNPTDKKSGNMVGYFGVGTSKSRDYKYEDLAEEGYMKNSIVYRCVNEISKGASSVPFMVKSGDQVLESHPLISLLSRPNPLQSHSEFFNSIFGFLMLSGNAYILRVGSEQGAPKELHLLRPDRMVIKGGSKPIPDRYEYMVNGRIQATYEVDDASGFSEVKHVKLWNPLDDFYGLSPMSAAAIEVDQHNMSGKHNVNLLSNGARPSGAVIFKPQDDAGITVNLSESQRQQLLTDLNNRFSGTANAGRPMLLEGDFDWKEMGLSPKDMDFINLKHMAATDIALCFGVPSQLVGVPDSQTYSNVAEARLALYEETIIPHLRKIESDLNEWLVPMFGEDLYFCFDIDKIPALAERTKRTYENITSAVREGIMTRNEAREQIGLSPIDGADDLYISANLFPIGEEQTPQVQDPIAEEEIDDYDVTEEFPVDDDEKAVLDIKNVVS
jgi:HK97 family phage portal protein